ncbi:MAG: ferrochelatase [Chloroflexi bacterium HGW-Chloroflexi-3]|nr:MAG: ferrochelatase [Chloroflexi bacterium HGW-Chloroflexi-3]
MKPTTAILMMAYGGPDSPESVEPYLLDVRGGRPTSPELIEEIRHRYEVIGGKSPLLDITRQQAQALENELNLTSNSLYKVFVGMRHWHPYIRETVADIAASGITKVIAICMTPFFSRMSIGTYYDHLDRAISDQTNYPDWQKNLSITKIGSWYSNHLFHKAIATNIQESLAIASKKGIPAPIVLFTAHSLPVILAEQGDPYAQQFSHLVTLVAEAAGLSQSQYEYCFQSAGAQNTRWFGPSLEETLKKFSISGKKSVLIAPIGFLSDHVEILYDIDVEAKRLSNQLNLQLIRISSPNDHLLFIKALANIIAESEQSL